MPQKRSLQASQQTFVQKRLRPSAQVQQAPFPMSRARRITASKETGFVDVAAASYAMDNAGTITHLSVIPQGASVSERVGKKVILKSLQFRGYVSNLTTAVFNDCAILIVYDRRPTGVLPAVTDVLNTSSALSMNNDANSGRFQIVRRFDFELIGNATLLTEGSAKSADYFVDLKSKPWVAKALGTGVIADVEEGALYAITVGVAAPGQTAAQLTGGYRLRFVDV